MPETNDSRERTAQSEPAGDSFSESREYQHERNPVAAAQKQMASQETAGLLDEQ
ncbi:hypothetical protein [Paenibacillus mucilaginosus]|uniref:Uncharacterized protein n=3 Tax=Paenibacillus mucilaginosus TaxID=61624 RepID=H6NRJ1_9BACL|nr:hypothetical protein [Paenibacillus mucilaginosus]AEI38967.1 hypothetical protein KNP414_00342 [Paenibacillus mucilaginosus KNP414]AFC27273.1 hypothetical protein PM3016_297 [Paenibacillus mucilaginosus 3016]AFH59414.1 hypothetical protein B2K_01505 [Paenibacillus mucilaginosus K02]MCG7216587.1 hypothetical protein [Paenibacillus mucilaginosus]WDM28011.1 hypothetical protein KCX80_01650 [Paenibacillus mucilaginosus]